MITHVALSRPYLHSTIDYVYEPPDAECYLECVGRREQTPLVYLLGVFIACCTEL